jgi:hypothetical protein
MERKVFRWFKLLLGDTNQASELQNRNQSKKKKLQRFLKLNERERNESHVYSQ